MTNKAEKKFPPSELVVIYRNALHKTIMLYGRAHLEGASEDTIRQIRKVVQQCAILRNLWINIFNENEQRRRYEQ